ncbi:hypothetical protein A2U01_0083615, partial [Trifolium medium]|nr:hypothetical protein [Trifolium medium]
RRASRPAELGEHIFALPFARRAGLAVPRAGTILRVDFC